MKYISSVQLCCGNGDGGGGGGRGIPNGPPALYANTGGFDLVFVEAGLVTKVDGCGIARVTVRTVPTRRSTVSCLYISQSA